MSYATAGSNRIRRLYRYQRFDQKHLGEAVEDNKVFFSDPRAFNDPWDCRPWFNLAGLDGSVALDQHIQWYKDITRRQRRDISEAEIEETALRLRSDFPYLREKIAQVSEALAQDIGERYRVCCLAERANCELMWAHYADRHRGVCLEFSTRNVVFCTALEVAYYKDYPVFDITASDEANCLLPLLAKSNAWEYEREYRLISQEASNATPHGTIISYGGKVGIPPDSLTGIIVGCLATDATVDAVRNIIRASGKPIKLMHCYRSPSRYELIPQLV